MFKTKQCFSNQQNFLPLHLAIKSGKTKNNGIGALLRAYPDSVNVIDPKSKLYPFLLSATMTKYTSAIDIESYQRSRNTSLDLTFQLLRRNPNLLQEYSNEKKRSFGETTTMSLQGVELRKKTKKY